MVRAIQCRWLVMGACLGAALLTANPSRAEVIDNESIPIELYVYVPCAADGAGEVVHLSGDLHVLFALTFDGAGGVHVKSHYQPQGLSGEGLTTGVSYHGVGVTQDEYNAKVGYEETFINNFRIIGQGPGNNYLIHQNFHVTVNANGTVTASVDNFSVECK